MSKTVLITGSSRGIGAAIAEKFARGGYNVIINYLSSQSKAEELLERLTAKTGSKIIAVKADVSDENDVQKLFMAAYNAFGGVDVLINNAAVSDIKMLGDFSKAEWDRTFDINVGSAFLCSKAAMHHMVNQKFGRIINISSMWGILGASCEVPYSASKAAMIGFTKALAKELAPSGITVNCIAPGIIDTDMNAHLSPSEISDFVSDVPVSRLGTPSEIAHAAYFLAGDESSYITGQVLSVDGGMT